MTGVPDDGRRWELVTGCGPFADLVGPLYMTRDELAGESVRFGMRVEERHCNPRPICHGGMLATLLDVALARGIRAISDLPAPLPTISITLDYLFPAARGDWVDARVSITRIGAGTCFAQAMLHVGATPVLRGSGVYKRLRPRNPDDLTA